jgi:hypothetical protein
MLYTADVCTFQHNFCHWTEPHSDQNKWVRHKGTTPSSHTGPTNDAHGSSSGKKNPHNTNINFLYEAVLDLTYYSRCLIFYNENLRLITKKN